MAASHERELHQFGRFVDSVKPRFVPEVDVMPRYHHIRFNDFERYEHWHKPITEQTAMSMAEALEEVQEELGVGFAYDDMSEFAGDVLEHARAVRRLRSIRSLPIPTTLSEAIAFLERAANAWEAAEGKSSNPLSLDEKDTAEALSNAQAAQAAIRDALLDMCPSLSGNVVSGLGVDPQWSSASMADLQRPAALPEDAARDPELAELGIRVSSVAEWRLALMHAYSGLEEGARATLVRRVRPFKGTRARNFEEHVLGASGTDSRVARSQAALEVGVPVGNVNARHGVAGPGAVHEDEAAPLEEIESSLEPSARGDAWDRKQRTDAAMDFAAAMMPWQSRKVPGRLSDGAPSHLRVLAEGLEKSSSHTAGERARLLQEASNRLDEAHEMDSRSIGPQDFARMEKQWAAPAQTSLDMPWMQQFPVNTRLPESGAPVPSSMFAGEKRPAELEPRLRDGAEQDAVFGAVNPGSAEVDRLGAGLRGAAKMGGYQAFLASVRKNTT
jgi:hypothetical protein